MCDRVCVCVCVHMHICECVCVSQLLKRNLRPIRISSVLKCESVLLSVSHSEGVCVCVCVCVCFDV